MSFSPRPSISHNTELALCPERHPHADFLRSLAGHVRHDAVDARHREAKGHDGKEAQQPRSKLRRCDVALPGARPCVLNRTDTSGDRSRAFRCMDAPSAAGSVALFARIRSVAPL